MSQTQAEETLRVWREAAPFWERYAPTIRAMFAPVTHALVEEAGITSGQSVLDVAGGPGEPSLTIAEAVGPTGSVTCTDAVAGMVAAAEREARRRGVTNIEFRQCTADALPFDDDTFDAAVSRLGVMFFPDPLAGLREMLRVVRPDCAVSLAVWGRSDLNPFAHVITSVVSRHVDTTPETGAPDAFRFAEPGTLARVLEEAGAAGVRERVLKFRIEAPVSPAEFWAMRSETSDTLRAKLAGLTAEARVRVAQEVEEAVREFFPEGLVSFPAQILVVTWNKPI